MMVLMRASSRVLGGGDELEREGDKEEIPFYVAFISLLEYTLYRHE